MIVRETLKCVESWVDGCKKLVFVGAWIQTDVESDPKTEIPSVQWVTTPT